MVQAEERNREGVLRDGVPFCGYLPRLGARSGHSTLGPDTRAFGMHWGHDEPTAFVPGTVLEGRDSSTKEVRSLPPSTRQAGKQWVV